MDLTNSNTAQNLSEAFGGESMANRKYLFFAEVTRRLGMSDLAKLFKETANQETEHAFAHFRLLHPELVVEDTAMLSEAEKQKIAARCLELAIEGETYEYTTMYPEFADAARQDRDSDAVAEFEAQGKESRQHASIFRQAAHNFGLLTRIEQYHARRYTDALHVLSGEETQSTVNSIPADTQLWICQKCSMIYDPAVGDPESGIAPGTPFSGISEDWSCPICGAEKCTFIPYVEPIAA
ncbi:rubrerythrin family protein [Leptolyngbya cf. ectocarpi LEGE 11479]|uniref:Rubrerythrin family protein n=1 Tax=Leptolyngbya cf. ectocarpi LEGE 11479 TaxID=1828722 RepID=A0A928ZVD6_LEPEC|nr:rubrerythrin family protein [Leptolyngbya ectocarpi]MBE9068170.1 rubrerythrin family protein [Leptolyngbya cf. ectocarpi LEGE 11479]